MSIQDKIEKLKGKSIVLEKTDVGDLLIKTSDGIEIILYAIGDCCSSSWIEHVDSPKEFEKFVSFKEVEISPTHTDNNEYHDDEVIEYYFYEFTTEKGKYLVEMRNSSNGYYGGYLE